jgi:hypothetical protein
MVNFLQVYEGWKNKLIPSSEMKELINKVSEERLALCNTCDHHSKFHDTSLRFDDHCTFCGCNLSAKVSCLSCECPIEGKEKKWSAISSIEEEDNLKNNM